MLPGGKIVIASHNKGKIAEIGELLSVYGTQAVSASAFNIDEPEETGATFAANAELKARYSQERSGLTALADDSGLVIPDLGGAPGIFSARWAGSEKDFAMAFGRIERELMALGKGTGTPAYFTCVLCLCLPDGKASVFDGRVYGTLTFPPQGEHGFGYDPIFIPDGYDITFAQMDKAEKNRISHRACAFEQLKAYIGEIA